MPEAVAKVPGEEEGMVFCPKLGCTVEAAYAVENIRGDWCRDEKRQHECCLSGKQEARMGEIASNISSIEIVGRIVTIPTDPIWSIPFPEEQRVFCLHPDAPEKAAAILLRENVLSGQCEICHFCKFQCIYAVNTGEDRRPTKHMPGHGFLYCPEKKKSIFMVNMSPVSAVEYCPEKKGGCGWQLRAV